MLKGDYFFGFVSLFMNISSFSPLSASAHSDTLCQLFFRLARISFWTTLLLIPLLFIPNVSLALGSIKIYVILVGALLSVIFVSLATLRSGRVEWWFSPIIISWLAVVGSGALSSLLSPRIQKSFFGDVLDIFNGGFLVVLALVMLLVVMLNNSKKQVKIFGGLVFGLMMFANLYQILLIVFGVTSANFNLPALSVVLFGPISDVAVSAGLLVLVSLMVLLQSRLTLLRLGIIAGTILVALFNLLVVNLLSVWLIISAFSLVLLLYALVKDLFLTASERTYRPKPAFKNSAIGIVTGVFLVSVTMLFFGAAISENLSRHTGVSYTNVSPSVGATIDIGREVYRENAFTGSGPNTFLEKWQLYKSEEINRTNFWNTPFLTGSSYVATWFVTTGLIGVLAWLAFLGSLLYVGVRMLLTVKEPDSFWFTVGTIAFVSAVYLWFILSTMNPGSMLIVMAIIAAAMVVVSARYLGLSEVRELVVVGNRRLGFALTGVVLVVILLSLSFGYVATRQTMAAYNFVTLPNKLGDSNELLVWEQGLRDSYALYASDIYLNKIVSLYQYRLGQLLVTEDPTERDQEEFIALLTDTITAGDYLVAQNPYSSQNWVLVADTFATLIPMEVEGALERAVESYQKAKSLNPTNPLYDLLLAQSHADAGDLEAARALIESALKLKPNYIDALNFSAQLELLAGDIEGAISRTQTLLSIEPNNSGRYYQLGILHAANENNDAAISAFDRALALDPEFANAKYVRALQYFEKGDTEKTLSELREVMNLSSDNAFLEDLIGQIERGEVTPADLRNTSVSEGEEVVAGAPLNVDLPENLNTNPSTEAESDTEEE